MKTREENLAEANPAKIFVIGFIFLTVLIIAAVLAGCSDPYLNKPTYIAYGCVRSIWGRNQYTTDVIFEGADRNIVPIRFYGVTPPLWQGACGRLTYRFSWVASATNVSEYEFISFERSN